MFTAWLLSTFESKPWPGILTSTGFVSLCSLEICFQKTEIKHDLDIMDVMPSLRWRWLYFSMKTQIPRSLKRVLKTIMAFPPLVSFSTLDTILTVVIILIIFITHEMSSKACSSRRQGTWVPVFVLWPIWNALLFLVLTGRANNILRPKATD